MDGVNLFQVVQATWNLLEVSAAPALVEAKAQGLGIIVKEALANGRLTDPAGGEHVTALRQEAIAHNTTVDAVALAAALSQPWADVVLSGAATVGQLRSNVEACTVNWDAEASDLLDALAEPPSAYWAARAGLAWN